METKTERPTLAPRPDYSPEAELYDERQRVVHEAFKWGHDHNFCSVVIDAVETIFGIDGMCPWSDGVWRDAEGRDYQGVDLDGFDRQGFDKNGFGRDGFDRNGRNRDGYDRNGERSPGWFVGARWCAQCRAWE